MVPATSPRPRPRLAIAVPLAVGVPSIVAIGALIFFWSAVNTDARHRSSADPKHPVDVAQNCRGIHS